MTAALREPGVVRSISDACHVPGQQGEERSKDTKKMNRMVGGGHLYRTAITMNIDGLGSKRH